MWPQRTAIPKIGRIFSALEAALVLSLVKEIMSYLLPNDATALKFFRGQQLPHSTQLGRCLAANLPMLFVAAVAEEEVFCLMVNTKSNFRFLQLLSKGKPDFLFKL